MRVWHEMDNFRLWNYLEILEYGYIWHYGAL